MSLFERLKNLFTQKATAAMDRAEDPREALELAYQKQLAQVQLVRRSVADVLTSQKRLEIEANQAAAAEQRLRTQAGDAVRRGSDDEARRLLLRAAASRSQVERLQSGVGDIREQVNSLEDLLAQLSSRVDAFRAQKEAARAQYTASTASVRAGEALTGLSADMQDVGPMVERARQKLLDLQARAAAVSQLAGSSVADPVALEPGGTDRAALEATADADLAALKRSLPPG